MEHRLLTLRQIQRGDRPLHNGGQDVLRHVARLWGSRVQLESANASDDVTKRFSLPAPG